MLEEWWDASPKLRSKKQLIKNFIAGINDDVDDVMNEWHSYVIFLNGNERLIEEELEKVIKNTYYTIEGNTMKIRFANVADLIITLRNRYFHMLVGNGKDNFYDTRYDKRDVFLVMNSVFINWLSMIYKEMVVYSVDII